MNETDHVRSYIERQIETSKSRLGHYLGQKSEAETGITRLTETLELLEGMLSYLERPEGSKEAQAPRVKEETQGAQSYADMSIANATFEILREKGIPLHVKTIWERLEQGGKISTAHKPTLSVTAALLRDERFQNIGGNKFRIKEFPSDTNEES